MPEQLPPEEQFIARYAAALRDTANEATTRVLVLPSSVSAYQALGYTCVGTETSRYAQTLHLMEYV